MSKFIRPLYPLREIISLDEIYYYPNLNIFSDASTRTIGRGNEAAAYAVAAVTGDNVIDTEIRIHSNTTSNAEELRGVKSAVAMGLKYRNMFSRINIFCDSLYAIDSLRKFPSIWEFNNSDHAYYAKSTGGQVKNMNTIAEALYMLEDLRKTTEVNIYYIKGHVNTESNDSKTYRRLNIAARSFWEENFNDVRRFNIHDRGIIDLNMIRYLCGYNNMVDSLSRGLLFRTNIFDNVYRDAVTFELDHPIYFN